MATNIRIPPVGAVPQNHATVIVPTAGVTTAMSQNRYYTAPGLWQAVGTSGTIAGTPYDPMVMVNRMKYVVDSAVKPTPLTGIAEHPKASELHSMHMWLLLNEDIDYPNHDAFLLRKRMFNHEVSVRARAERWDALKETIRPGLEHEMERLYRYGSGTASQWNHYPGSSVIGQSTHNNFNPLKQQTNPVKPYLIDLELEEQERQLEKARFIQAMKAQIEADKLRMESELKVRELYLGTAEDKKQERLSGSYPGVGSKGWFSKIFGSSGV